jgi:hypothetical protein
VNELNGHEQEKYVCLWIRREDNRHSNRRRIMVWLRKLNGAESCLVRRTEICTWELCSELLQQVITTFGIGGDAYRHKDVHRAGQGRQQRIVCVKDDEMNKQQPIAG